MNDIITTIHIQSHPFAVWSWLTERHLMKRWMGEPEMNIDIATDWTIGDPIIVRGFQHVKFENKGLVLKYDPHKIIQYTHLSSISRLPDLPMNYSTITFTLEPKEQQTALTIQVENFPNESIFKHLHLYWTTTPAIIKGLVERDKS
jgi:uncharacterized protein YndB with AHSA1/START domain